jgi:hypothetical protein
MQFWRRTGLVIAVATVINVAVFLIARAIGVEILVPQGATSTTLSVVPVAVFTIVPLVLAAVFLRVLRRVGVSSPRVFGAIVVVGTLLSLFAPLTAELSASNKVTLVVMHLVAGLAALIGLTPLYRPAPADARTLAVSNV